MARWRFQGVSTRLDISEVIASSAALSRARDRLARRVGGDVEGQRVLENVVEFAFNRFGEHFVSVKGDLIETVLAKRSALEDVLENALDPSIRQQSVQQIRQDVQRLGEELDRALRELAEPVHDLAAPDDLARTTRERLEREVAELDPTPTRQTDRPITRDTTRQPGEARSRLRRKGYTHDPATGIYLKEFAGGTVELEIVDGRYRGRAYDPDGNHIMDFEEYGVLSRHGDRPTVGSVMQSHHVLQDNIMQQVFGRYGYDRDAVPTMWLRDSRSGSPHGRITDVQNHVEKGNRDPRARQQRQRGAPTFAEIRQWSIEDALAAGASRQQVADYLVVFDRYFRENVLPNIPEAQRARVLGDWEP